MTITRRAQRQERQSESPSDPLLSKNQDDWELLNANTNSTPTAKLPHAIMSLLTSRWFHVAAVAFLSLSGVAFFFIGLERSSRDTAEPDTNNSVARPFVVIPDSSLLAPFENCTISYQPPPPRPQSEWKLPFWLPAYPGSGAGTPARDGDIVKRLVDAVTGMQTGTKNYHASRRGVLKRCKSTATETVACEQAHPIVPIGPEKRTDAFQPTVIFVVRNFKAVFPVEQNDRLIAYHNWKGQQPEEEWRLFRDSWMEGAFKKWKDMILTWKRLDYYKIGMYVPFERLINPKTGPALTQRLADQFQNAGFPVAPKEDIPCIWYRTLKYEWSRLKEYYKFKPGYTIAQRDFLLRGLEAFLKEVSNDKELFDILNEYYVDVRDYTRIDRPWVNQTKV